MLLDFSAGHPMIPRSARCAIALAIIMGLAACGGPDPGPVVDMEGVDQVKYNRDLADCYNEKRFATEWGSPITNCMRAKGYKILVRR